MKISIKILFILLFSLLCLNSCNKKLKKDLTNKKEDKIINKKEINLTKKELRGVWIATIWNLDWPLKDYSMEGQKKKYINYMNLFKSLNINAVFVQIRSGADAFYDSPYEPWSEWITGVRGKNPGYDVLKFMIEEAHKKGIQFHAWINPYRISSSYGSNPLPELDKRISKSIVKDYMGLKTNNGNTYNLRLFNPALEESRQRIANIISDLIKKYNVDGIHFDDFFYPNTKDDNKLNDNLEYKELGKGYKTIKDFRMDNVNKLILKVRQTINSINPNIIFSISPAGNMENNLGYLNADIGKWCREGWIDIIIPQLYFTMKYFKPRLSQFIKLSGKANFMIGYNIYDYDINAKENSFKTSKLIQQEYNLAKEYNNIKGGVLYSAKYLMLNKVGIKDMIKKIYSKPAIIPYLSLRPENKPQSPKNLIITGSKLRWEGSGDYFAIYKDDDYGSRRGRNAGLIGTTKEHFITLNQRGTYYVTALNTVNSESKISKAIEYK